MPSSSPHEGGGAWPGGVNGMVPPGPLGIQYLFGDGSYSGNIIQGGVALQPQDYLLDGITPLAKCIVVTGAATVAPDATTGAAWFSCQNLVVTGATASLTASVNCKGLIGVVKGKYALRSGATSHMTKKGKAGNFGNLTVFDLIPRSYSRKLKPILANYMVLGEGALPGVTGSAWNAPKPGLPAGAMQTGGGGQGSSAGAALTWTAGKGGPCCGGAGSGAGYTGAGAGHYGGPGGPGGNDTSHGYGGGAGDPVGPGWDYHGGGNPGDGPGGGLFMVFASDINVASGCIVAADGGKGGSAANCAGGSAGGGCIVFVYNTYTNNGTVRANGGAATASPVSGAAGGVGSVNLFQVAA